MKLSDLKPEDVTPVGGQSKAPLRLSALSASDVVPIAQAPAPADDPSASPVTALTSGFFSAIPGAKQIAAGTKTAMDVINGNTDLSDALGEYRDERDKLSGAFDAARAAHPKTAMLGGLAGSVASAPGIAALAGPGLIAQGAAYGGAQALSDSKADLTTGNLDDYEQAALDTAKGAGIGALTAGVVQGVTPYAKQALSATGDALSSGASRFANGLDSFAERRAVRSLNPTTTEIKALQASPGIAGQAGSTGENKLGRTLLDNDIISPLSSLSNKQTAIEGLLDQSGQDISASGKGAVVSPQEIADEAGARLEEHASDPYYQNALKKLDPTWQTLDGLGTDPIPFEDAQGLKRSLDNEIGPKSWQALQQDQDVVKYKQLLAKVRGAVSDKTEEAVESQLGPDAVDAFRTAKGVFGQGKVAQGIVDGSVARQEANKTFGLTDTILGTGSYAAFGPKGLIALGAKKVAEKYGNNVAALGADRLGDIVRATPEVFGKYAAPLVDAISRGGNSLAATQYLLQQQDPEFRQKMKDVLGQE